MKIILSRKGFDSAAGGYANPILPDGTLLSLPIPDSSTEIKYSDLIYKEKSYYAIMQDLKGDFLKENGERTSLNERTTCHLDPDIRSDVLIRCADWTALFGQLGAAQKHLQNQEVGVNDLFLFFGWFRRTVEINGKLKFDPRDKNGRHVIYGYFQVGDVIKADNHCKINKWMHGHPHTVESRLCCKNNVIYVARDRLSHNEKISGFGVFNYSEHRVLTKMGCTRSQWQLPETFKDVRMSYHSDNSWHDDYFQSAKRGQEFVIEENKNVLEWAKGIISSGFNHC